MIRKPFTKLNDVVQSRLQFLAEKFNTSITKVAFVSLFIPIYSLFFLRLIYIFTIDRGASPSPQISVLIFATLSILIVEPSLIYRRFGELAKHDKKIRELQQKYNKFKRLPITGTRVFGVAFFSILSIALLWLIYKNPYEWVILDTITRDTKSIISLSTLIITTPIAFIVWVFRDKNKLLELENARKDTNLKEFQQLQRWATGNIDGNNKSNKVVLQISALHSLCAYLKGEYGESFRRGAYEIFRATLATQHQKILTQVRNNKFENIANAIDDCQLTKQLNVIASEEWFNLLINHNFPTKGISLVGVDLSRTYLHHRTYSKTLDLREAQLQGANLQSTQLQGVNLFNAQLQGANLQRTQLQGANLQGTQLQGANLQSAQLQGVILIDAQLQEVILIDAQLQGVNLFNAQLQGANLENTQLQGAYVKKYEWKNFEQRIKRQINKKTDIQNLEKQCEELGDANKLDFPESKASSGISHIESASEMLDLSKAITGKYSRKEANKWINNYKNVKKNDF